MNLIAGKDRFPMLQFENKKYTHIVPVTKYQFERFIWETSPGLNYDAMIEKNSRISPHELNINNGHNLFINQLSFDQALIFARWMGGRLPTKNEINVIYDHIASINPGSLLKFYKDRLVSITHGELDARWLTLISIISYYDEDLVFLHFKTKEIVSKLVTLPGSELFLTDINTRQCLPFAGNRQSSGSFCFRVVVDN